MLKKVLLLLVLVLALTVPAQASASPGSRLDALEARVTQLEKDLTRTRARLSCYVLYFWNADAIFWNQTHTQRLGLVPIDPYPCGVFGITRNFPYPPFYSPGVKMF